MSSNQNKIEHKKKAWLARKGKILVVDDQIFNIDTLKEMMSLLGVDINRDVEEALNGQ